MWMLHMLLRRACIVRVPFLVLFASGWFSLQYYRRSVEMHSPAGRPAHEHVTMHYFYVERERARSFLIVPLSASVSRITSIPRRLQHKTLARARAFHAKRTN